MAAQMKGGADDALRRLLLREALLRQLLAASHEQEEAPFAWWGLLLFRFALPGGIPLESSLRCPLQRARGERRRGRVCGTVTWITVLAG